MIRIGTNKFEGIDWVQERLGPVTPRNIAEDTYNALLREGLIEWDSRTYDLFLVEDLDQDELRRRARNGMIVKDQRRIARKGPKGKLGNHKHDRSTHRHDNHHNQQMKQMKQCSDALACDLDDDDK